MIEDIEFKNMEHHQPPFEEYFGQPANDLGLHRAQSMLILPTLHGETQQSLRDEPMIDHYTGQPLSLQHQSQSMMLPHSGRQQPHVDQFLVIAPQGTQVSAVTSNVANPYEAAKKRYALEQQQ